MDSFCPLSNPFSTWMRQCLVSYSYLAKFLGKVATFTLYSCNLNVIAPVHMFCYELYIFDILHLHWCLDWNKILQNQKIKNLDSDLLWVSRRKLDKEKIEKTISIPLWYRYGFLEILLKNTSTGMLSRVYESNICAWAEVVLKTAKNTKKPYLYLRGIDMVFWKFSPLGCFCINHIISIDNTIELLDSEPLRVFKKKIRQRKLERPYLYHLGMDMVFWEILLKTAKNHIYTSLV